MARNTCSLRSSTVHLLRSRVPNRTLALGQTECQSIAVSTPLSAAKLGDWHEVAPGVFVLVAEPAAVNLALVVGSDAAVMVDAGSSPTQGAALRRAVGAVTDRPLAAVVATHWHYDHAFGLAGFDGVETIAHEA